MERQQLELYVSASQEPTPSWYFPVRAAAVAITIATLDLDTPWITILAAFSMGAVIGGSVRAMENQTGFSPRPSALPPELRRGLYGYMIGHTPIVGAIVIIAAVAFGSDWRFTIVGVASGLVFWLGATSVQRSYRAHSRVLAEQAGIDLG